MPDQTPADNTGGTGTPTQPHIDQPDILAQLEAAKNEAANWRNRFTGLQTTYQRDQGKWNEDAKKLAEVSEASAKLQEERSSLQTTATSIQEKYDQMSAELATLKASQERQTIIIKEFPQLLGLESEGLLPDGSGDELRGLLKKMSDKLVALNKDAFAHNLGGSLPTPPAPRSDKSADEWLKESMDLFRAGKVDEYNKAYDEYLKASKR